MTITSAIKSAQQNITSPRTACTCCGGQCCHVHLLGGVYPLQPLGHFCKSCTWYKLDSVSIICLAMKLQLIFVDLSLLIKDQAQVKDYLILITVDSNFLQMLKKSLVYSII